MRRGVGIGRLFGIPLRLDLTWLLGLALVVAGPWQLWAPDLGRRPALALALAFALAFFACLVAHELSHALVARALGVPTAEITLFVFGGVARITAEPPDPGGEALMAMAGPLASVTLGGLLLLAAEATSAWPGELLGLLGAANLVLAVFNLLPGFPLDGGRVARAVLWRLTGRRLLATRLTAWFGRGLAVLLVGGGLAAVAVLRSPRYLLQVVLGVFLWQAAVHGERAAWHSDRLARTTVGDVMRTPPPPVVEPLDPALVVDAAEPLGEFLRRYRAAPAARYLVVDADRRVAGTLDGAVLRRVGDGRSAHRRAHRTGRR